FIGFLLSLVRSLCCVLNASSIYHFYTLSLHDALPISYLFINQSADYPKAMGFDLELKPLSDERYKYQLYVADEVERVEVHLFDQDRKSTRLNSSHVSISYAVLCLKKKMTSQNTICKID